MILQSMQISRNGLNACCVGSLDETTCFLRTKGSLKPAGPKPAQTKCKERIISLLVSISAFFAQYYILKFAAVRTNIAESHLLRAAAASKRFGTGPMMSQKPPAGTVLDTSTLLSHEHGGGAPGEDKITVGWAVRESKGKGTNPDLGTSAKKWAVSMFLPDIKAHLVKTLNLEWGRSNSLLLLPEEVTFRWHGGVLLELNTANMTLGQFYAFYSTPSRAPIYLVAVPASWKSMAKQNKGPTIWLELYIDSAAFKVRFNALNSAQGSSCVTSVNSMMNSALTSVVRKRALSSTSEGANRDHDSNKRTNAGPMKSMFLPSSSTSLAVHKRSAVMLQKFICVADPITGQTEFESSGTVVSGAIRDTHFSEGAMKSAYDFKTNSGQALVVKRFYRISDQDDHDMAASITVLENRDQIYLELRRLTLASYFLKAYFLHAKRQGVNIYTAIAFADAWLGEETRITWLVETKRSTTVEHFTFTLNHHTHRQDLCAQTIHAFAHFVYGNSNKNVVLADIQGTPAHLNGQDVMVLFDPMTHTPAGDSGIGDFGAKGIQSFIHDHKCNDVCRSLGLDESVILEAEPVSVEKPTDGSESPNPTRSLSGTKSPHPA
ncbi:kinase-like domain-containing protein [Mycena vulgaris]|nr:kinase-like domain-containing protein [Mycena vulgaris]